MPDKLTLEKIERESEKLALEDQLKLIEWLIQGLIKKKIDKKKLLDWKHLYGLGKGIWEGKDAQEYVNALREDRI